MNEDKFNLYCLPYNIRKLIVKEFDKFPQEDRWMINFIFDNHLDEIPGFVEHNFLGVV